MEEEKTTIIKPPFWLSAQLYLFMMLVIACFVGAVSGISLYGRGNVQHFSSGFMYAIGALDLLMYAYALTSIYKMLQRRPYSLVMLRLSLVYVGVQQLVRAYAGIQFFIPTVKYVNIVAVGWILFFLIYLSRSEKVRKYLPKKERKFGWQGAAGIGIYLLVFALFAIPNYNERKEMQRSLQVAVRQYRLKDGWYTNGYVKFRPDPAWKEENIGGDMKKGETVFFGFRTKDHSLVTVTASPIVDTLLNKIQDRVDFCELVYQTFDSILSPEARLTEVAHHDEELPQGSSYMGVYRDEGKSGYWTVAALTDKDSYKVMLLIINDKHGYDQSVKDATALMKSATFRLE